MATKTSTARQSTAPARKATKARAPKKAEPRAKVNTLPSRAKGDFANDMTPRFFRAVMRHGVIDVPPFDGDVAPLPGAEVRT